MHILGPGYVFEASTLNYGGSERQKWMLRILAAGIFSRADAETIHKILGEWLKKHGKDN